MTYVEIPNGDLTQEMLDASGNTGTPGSNTCRKTNDGYTLVKFGEVPESCSGYTQYDYAGVLAEIGGDPARWGDDP